jgi:hypothetical protein
MAHAYARKRRRICNVGRLLVLNTALRRRRRGFNVGHVLVLNDPPRRRRRCACS